ncbi:hypothetical protein [Hyphomicrobium sp.]|uniref:hypothetical protein n=1 Tax=Hyphomicrobium sp. TaxID=82 RepID=UPI003F712DC4
MTRLETPTVLIIDGATLSSFHLRARLIDAGCNVRVVGSLNSALMVAHRNRVNVVFLEYSEGQATRNFCTALAGLNIPHIFTATGLDETATRPPFVNHFSKLKDPAEHRTF